MIASPYITFTRNKCFRRYSLRFAQSVKSVSSPISRGKFTKTTVTTSDASSRITLFVEKTVSPLQRIWYAYERSLYDNPLLTKASMAAVIFFVSDTATQYITSDNEKFEWSLSRALSGSSFGIVATGCLHYWWGFLDAAVNKRLPLVTHKFANTAIKVFLDQSIKAPLYIYTYFVLTKFLNEQMNGSQNWHESWNDANNKAGEIIFPTMLQHWRLWIPVHSINFYFVPLHHRVLVQNSVLVFWSGYLSYLNHNRKTIMTPNDEVMAALEHCQQ